MVSSIRQNIIGTDEAFFEVGVNHTGRLLCCGTDRVDLRGFHLTGGKIALQTEHLVGLVRSVRWSHGRTGPHLPAFPLGRLRPIRRFRLPIGAKLGTTRVRDLCGEIADAAPACLFPPDRFAPRLQHTEWAWRSSNRSLKQPWIHSR